MHSFFKKLFGLDSSNNASLPQELVHINQEMYKKSLELTERNKTLLLLRKIDEIIISSVTDQIEIAKRVTSLLISEGDFQIASIFTYEKDKNILRRLSTAEAGPNSAINNGTEATISLNEKENVMVQVAERKQVMIIKDTKNVFLEHPFKPEIIKCVFVYPLITREELIGTMVIALREEEYSLSDYSRDLLERLVQVVGIAIDNALLYNQLQDANEKLKALDKLKDEFVSLASHELRTPMTAIKSYLWMTLQEDAGPLNANQKLYLERAYSSVDRLIKLVNDMLNISRIESGRLTIQLDKVDMNKIAQEVVAEVTPRAKELEVSVVIDSNPSLPAVIADTDKIKEVLFNLIGNSLKFTQKGGTIKVSFAHKDNYIETKVSDTGSGISPENISKLFQKFAMLSESYLANQTASGTGLGLYISRSIIELHRGKIWAASDGMGKGSQFYFTLKVFSEADFNEFTANKKEDAKENVGIVHTQL